MIREFVFNSALAEYIEGLLSEKRAMGYKYNAQGYILKRFDSYWINMGYKDPVITRESLDGWYMAGDSEGKASRGNRIGAVKELALYMRSRGMEAYVPQRAYHKEKRVPHLFTDDEICAFFQTVDSYMPNTNMKNQRWMAGVYKIIFRMYYCLGLRRTEACELRMCDVDLEKGSIMIRDGKGNKDRIVYIPEDLRLLCAEYLAWLHTVMDCESEWFFPGITPDRHISAVRIDAKFQEFWHAAAGENDTAKKPTPHCFRHKFVQKRMDTWMKEGVDLPVMMPYLSRHLGHRGEIETIYYYHTQKESFRSIRDKDILSGNVIPEVDG